MDPPEIENHGEENTFPGTVSDYFSTSNGYSGESYYEDESQTYYSENLGEGDTSRQDSYVTSGDESSVHDSTNSYTRSEAQSTSFEGDSFAADSFHSSDNEQSQQHQQQHPPSQGPQTSSDELLANDYRKEFEDLLELAENGDKLTDEEEDRLYFLELFARRRIGEDLDEEEMLDLEDWMREEEKHLLDEKNSVEQRGLSETIVEDREVSDHGSENGSASRHSSHGSTSSRTRKSDSSQHSAGESEIDEEELQEDEEKSSSSPTRQSGSDGFGVDSSTDLNDFHNASIGNVRGVSQDSLFPAAVKPFYPAGTTVDTEDSNVDSESSGSACPQSGSGGFSVDAFGDNSGFQDGTIGKANGVSRGSVVPAAARGIDQADAIVDAEDSSVDSASSESAPNQADGDAFGGDAFGDSDFFQDGTTGNAGGVSQDSVFPATARAFDEAEATVDAEDSSVDSESSESAPLQSNRDAFGDNNFFQDGTAGNVNGVFQDSLFPAAAKAFDEAEISMNPEDSNDDSEISGSAPSRSSSGGDAFGDNNVFQDGSIGNVNGVSQDLVFPATARAFDEAEATVDAEDSSVDSESSRSALTRSGNSDGFGADALGDFSDFQDGTNRDLDGVAQDFLFPAIPKALDHAEVKTGAEDSNIDSESSDCASPQSATAGFGGDAFGNFGECQSNEIIGAPDGIAEDSVYRAKHKPVEKPGATVNNDSDSSAPATLQSDGDGFGDDAFYSSNAGHSETMRTASNETQGAAFPEIGEAFHQAEAIADAEDNDSNDGSESSASPQSDSKGFGGDAFDSFGTFQSESSDLMFPPTSGAFEENEKTVDTEDFNNDFESSAISRSQFNSDGLGGDSFGSFGKFQNETNEDAHIVSRDSTFSEVDEEMGSDEAAFDARESNNSSHSPSFTPSQSEMEEQVSESDNSVDDENDESMWNTSGRDTSSVTSKHSRHTELDFEDGEQSPRMGMLDDSREFRGRGSMNKTEGPDGTRKEPGNDVTKTDTAFDNGGVQDNHCLGSDIMSSAEDQESLESGDMTEEEMMDSDVETESRSSRESSVESRTASMESHRSKESSNSSDTYENEAPRSLAEIEACQSGESDHASGTTRDKSLTSENNLHGREDTEKNDPSGDEKCESKKSKRSTEFNGSSFEIAFDSESGSQQSKFSHFSADPENQPFFPTESNELETERLDPFPTTRESSQCHTSEGQASDEVRGSTCSTQDINAPVFGVDDSFDGPGDEGVTSNVGSVASKAQTSEVTLSDQSSARSERLMASNVPVAEPSQPDRSFNGKNGSQTSEANSLLSSSAKRSTALSPGSHGASLSSAYSGSDEEYSSGSEERNEGEDSWSQLDQPGSPSTPQSMDSSFRRSANQRPSSITSHSQSSKRSTLSASASNRFPAKSDSTFPESPVLSKANDQKTRTPGESKESEPGSGKQFQSEASAKSLSLSHRSISQTEGFEHSDSRSVESENNGAGDSYSREAPENGSVPPRHSESFAAGSLGSPGESQPNGLAKELSPTGEDLKSAGSIDERSCATSAERSVRFDMTPKSQKSESSLHLGDVFGKPSTFFDGNSQSTKSSASKSDTELSQKKSRNSAVRPKKPKKIRSGKEMEERRKKRKKRRRLKKKAKSPALMDLVANVNDAISELENYEDETGETNMDNSAQRLLRGFDALVGIFVQLSDEIELMVTFNGLKKKEEDIFEPHQALKEVLSFAESLDQLFADLKPILLDCLEEAPDEEMDDMLFRLNSLVDLLCETSHRVGERQEWNYRVETVFVTLFELMELETLELQCYFDDVDVPEQGVSASIYEAWSETGHIEELGALQLATNDPLIFRQICYEVMVSTDQWCPDVTMLMEICEIDATMLEEEPDPDYLKEEDLAPIPEAAEHVLDKINGDPLPRSATLASILRRILPPRAMTDLTLLDHFTSIRNTLNSPLGLSATNIVAISSAAEVVNDPEALGVGGTGKTTLAAMVAEHPDVRRYFIDGVVWIHVGEKELTYSRYTHCLRDLVAQLDFYEGEPLFAELIHTPGECLTKRRRREEGFMIYARDTIVELLEDRSVLIILDDICFEPDLDWFDFAPNPEGSQDGSASDVALLVTTRVRNLLPAADTVEVDMLDEADAISLLIQESGQLSHTLMAESREARSVVRECAYHPLAVKSVGRWLNLKHATAGVVSSVEEIHAEVVKTMDNIFEGGDHSGTDMMYEILSLSMSPAINEEPTNIIKFCFAAFVVVFCNKEYISDFALNEPNPIIPMDTAELLFETLLEINESSLLQEGSRFYAQKDQAAVLIPEALSALGIMKFITYDDEEPEDEQRFLQVMHSIHHEYGEYLCYEEPALKELTRDAEQEWNRSLVEASLKEVEEWDMDLADAGHSYALEMIIAHMIRGGMYGEAADLLAKKSFVRGRLLSLGRENATRRHIKDCEMLSTKLNEGRSKISKLEPRIVMKHAYQALGSQLSMDYDDEIIEDPRIKDIEIARAHHEIGFSLAENRCWDAAIAHWETSQELLEKALGTVEVVAGIMHNIGVVYAEMNEYEQALDSIKQCLRIRGTIHGEQHILYAQTIQRIGDIFLAMSDYNEAVESYNWALDVMYKEPALHRVEIGEILDNKGTIHYSKGETDEALKCHKEALQSKQVDLGEDHPELVVTYRHIGNCLSDQEDVDDAIIHLEEAIRLLELDLDGGPERDSDILTIEGIIHNLEGNQDYGLECYEKSLQILVSKVPHRKEKVASLLHLIGCVYLVNKEHKKAMKLFEESLQARRKVLGFVHLDVASTLYNMSFLHQTRNRLEKALKCLEEALKIRQLRLPDSEKVAVTHEKIGSLARTIGKTKKAQIAFESALEIRKLIHGERHEAVATVLQELGDLMDDIGDYETAMLQYIDALDIRRNRLGLDHIAVAETLYSMGYTLHNKGEVDRALVCFEESLSIRRYQLGEDSMEVGDTLNMMGYLKAKRGELDDALTTLWDALRIRKLQEDNVKVSETLKNIGNVHREKKEHILAVRCYEECLRIRRTELGEEHEKVADALIAMGNVFGDMKQNDDAMRSYQEALRIRTLVFGEQDESVAAVLQYMGSMELRAGNHERALDLLTEFIRIRRDNNTKNDGDFVNVLFSIGSIHKLEGNLEEARRCWMEAYRNLQELGLEETNPQIASTLHGMLQHEMREANEVDQKKNAALTFFDKIAAKTKELAKDEKRLGGKKRRKGKGIQL
eukprot:scaffold22568_cov125-Cylindrotheca_fusiformis.AAC.5